MINTFVRQSKSSICLTVKARPGTSRPQASRVVGISGGKSAIEVFVSDAPEGGKANKAICRHIARALGLKSSEVSLKTGQTSRIKTIEVRGDPMTTLNRIEAWLGL